MLEIVGGLKENTLEKTGCGKVKGGKLPGLSAAHRRAPVGRKACGGHGRHRSEQILFSVCGDFLTGCRAIHNNVRPSWEQLRDGVPPKGEEVDA